MHQPERGGVEDEPHLIGGRAVTRHAIRRQLRLVQLDQVLHLPALAIDVLVKVPRRVLERGNQEVDIRYLVTSLQGSARHPYENVYGQRGPMENLIKLHKSQVACERM